MKKIVLLCYLLSGIVLAQANTYTVTNCNDSGAGSLRQAMTDATSGYTGNHTISFNIPTTDAGYDASSGTFTIHLLSELPYLLIGGHITIDATTQATNVGNTNPDGPEIVLDGGDMSLMSCFRIASAGNTIKGFCIGGFQYAILLFGANGGTISDCYLGTAADGTTAFPNQYGIGLSGGTYGTFNLGYARNVTISNNIISGNTAAGIVLEGSGTRNNTIVGNKIGTSANGENALSNHYGIIVMTNANCNTIGGVAPETRNIISANTEIGIYIESADSNIVQGNYIGPDITGTRAFEYAPDSAIQANGVEINTTGQHNLIGGNTPEARNIISGNRVYGCIYYGNCAHNNIAGNYIGTDATGENALPNATGICVDGSSNHNTMENNVLSGNRSYGLFIVTRGTDGNIFRGNLVGTNATGTRAIPNDVGLMLAADAKENLIGGENDNERNLFSGNIYAGIEVTDAGTDHNRIVGNLIGTDITGENPLPNENGIIVSALVKYLDIDRNDISFNTGFGVVITDRADSNVVRRNRIASNGACGLLLAGGATHTLVGGDNEGNTILYNDSVGLVLNGNDTRFNTFSQNVIDQNQYASIFFMNEGCNEGIHPPQITSVIFDTTTMQTWIRGTTDVANPQNSVIEVFLAAYTGKKDPFGHAAEYAGWTVPDANGNWQLVVSGYGNCDPFSATVTDAAGNTSVLSADQYSTVSLTENDENFLSVSPNPTFGNLQLSIRNSQFHGEVIVYDSNGKYLFSKKIEGENTELDLTRYAPGTYYLRVMDGQNVLKTFKVVKMGR